MIGKGRKTQKHHRDPNDFYVHRPTTKLVSRIIIYFLSIPHDMRQNICLKGENIPWYLLLLLLVLHPMDYDHQPQTLMPQLMDLAIRTKTEIRRSIWNSILNLQKLNAENKCIWITVISFNDKKMRSSTKSNWCTFASTIWYQIT